MALTKEVKIDKIEVVGDFNYVQVRTATVILDDGVEISSSYHRHVISPSDDCSQEDAKVQAVCAAVHTPEIKAAWEAAQSAEPEALEG
jgi:hypothetical protein